MIRFATNMERGQFCSSLLQNCLTINLGNHRLPNCTSLLPPSEILPQAAAKLPGREIVQTTSAPSAVSDDLVILQLPGTVMSSWCSREITRSLNAFRPTIAKSLNRQFAKCLSLTNSVNASGAARKVRILWNIQR